MKVGTRVVPRADAMPMFASLDAETVGVVVKPIGSTAAHQIRVRIGNSAPLNWDARWWKRAPRGRK